MRPRYAPERLSMFLRLFLLLTLVPVVELTILLEVYRGIANTWGTGTGLLVTFGSTLLSGLARREPDPPTGAGGPPHHPCDDGARRVPGPFARRWRTGAGRRHAVAHPWFLDRHCRLHPAHSLDPTSLASCRPALAPPEARARDRHLSRCKEGAGLRGVPVRPNNASSSTSRPATRRRIVPESG